jgi:hypothetical protein
MMKVVEFPTWKPKIVYHYSNEGSWFETLKRFQLIGGFECQINGIALGIPHSLQDVLALK